MQTGKSMIAKVSSILGSFDSSSVQTASEVARRTGMPLPTTHRIMMELASYGYLERDRHQKFRIGIRLWELGTQASVKVSLREIALPYMNDLHRMVRHHTQLAVLDGTDVIYLAKLSEADSAVNITRVAGRLPASLCSPGIVLAAFAPPDVRQRILEVPRQAFTPQTVVDESLLSALIDRAVHEEVVETSGWIHVESTGLATPIRDGLGEVVAALTLIVPASSSLRQSAKAPLLMAGRSISRAIAATSKTTMDLEEVSLRSTIQRFTA